MKSKLSEIFLGTYTVCTRSLRLYSKLLSKTGNYFLDMCSRSHTEIVPWMCERMRLQLHQRNAAIVISLFVPGNIARIFSSLYCRCCFSLFTLLLCRDIYFAKTIVVGENWKWRFRGGKLLRRKENWVKGS